MTAQRQHDFAFCGKFVIAGILECVTGTHIGGAQEKFEIGGVDNPVIKDPITDLPYIPGSSLKGKLRSLLEWARDTQAVQQKHSKHGIFGACECGECVVCRLFGVASDDRNKRMQAGPTRLLVRDAFPTGYEAVLKDEEPPPDSTVGRWWEMLGIGVGTELKTENFLDRITSEANPRTMERVPAGSEFQVEFVLDVYNARNDKELLQALAEAMALLEHSSLGGSGSRGYGRVRFKNLTVTWFPRKYYQTGEGAKLYEVGTVAQLQTKVDELWQQVGSSAAGEG